MDNVIAVQPAMRNPERIAWGILLVAFAIFCLSCVLSMVFVYYFFFESTVMMTVEANPSRGTGGFTGSSLSEQVLRPRLAPFTSRTTFRTDLPSQIVLSFRDPHLDNRLVALVTLKDNSVLDFIAAERPRFEWGSGVYRITLERAYGEIDVLISDNLPHDVELNLSTKKTSSPTAELGALIGFGDSGHYTVDVNDERISVMNHDGEVVLRYYPDLSFGRSIPVGSRGVVSNQDTEITLEDIQTVPNPFVDLLENSRFNDILGNIPTKWACGNQAGNMPSGRYTTYIQDERPVLQFVRGENANTHGETFCKQGLSEGERWIDVTSYNVLELHVSLYIQYQSYPACGDQGSECPLMVLIEYEDINGNDRELFYGFYAVPRPDLPARCQSCWQDHIQIGEQVWYNFDSGNIFSILPEDQRPAYISSVYFYASGHQYDTRISQVSLIGRVPQQ